MRLAFGKLSVESMCGQVLLGACSHKLKTGLICACRDAQTMTGSDAEAGLAALVMKESSELRVPSGLAVFPLQDGREKLPVNRHSK